MSSTTGEHTNELEARRQRRQARKAASSGGGQPPRDTITAPAARDLLRDLITNTAAPGEDQTGPPHPDDPAGTPIAATETAGADSRGVTPARPAERGHSGEAVDELVKRVQAGTQAAAADAKAATRPRPVGTADLAADAAARRRSPRSARPPAERTRPPRRRVSWPSGRLAILTATCAVAAAAAGAVALASGGPPRHASTPSRPSMPVTAKAPALTAKQTSAAARARAATGMRFESRIAARAAAQAARRHRQQVAARRHRRQGATRARVAAHSAPLAIAHSQTALNTTDQQSTRAASPSQMALPPSTATTASPTQASSSPATNTTNSSSQPSAGSGSTPAPAGPTSIGTVSGGCNPKC